MPDPSFSLLAVLYAVLLAAAEIVNVIRAPESWDINRPGAREIYKHNF